MSGPSLPVLFVCTPLGGTRLTRRACGMRHLEAKIASKGGKMVVRDDTCRSCSVGEKHASGLEPARWPDGSPIATATPSVPQPPGTPAVKPINLDAPVRAKRAVPVPAPAPKETDMARPPKLYTHDGKTQALSAWAEQLGIDVSTLRARIKDGMEPSRAFSAGPLTPDRAQPKKPRADAPAPAALATDAPAPERSLKIRVRTVGVDEAVAKVRRTAAAFSRKVRKPSSPESDGVIQAAALSDRAESLRQLLTAAGFVVKASGPVPAGIAVIVEAP